MADQEQLETDLANAYLRGFRAGVAGMQRDTPPVTSLYLEGLWDGTRALEWAREKALNRAKETLTGSTL